MESSLNKPNTYTKINFSAILIVFAWPLIRFILYFFTRAITITFNTIFLFIILTYFLIILILWLVNEKNKKQCLKNIKNDILGKPELIILACFLLWMTISCFFSIEPVRSLFGISCNNELVEEGLTQFYFYGCMFIFAYTLRDENKTILLLKVLMYFSLIISILVFIDPDSKFFPAFLKSYPYSAMFVNPNHYGYYLTLVSLIATGLSLSEKNIYKKILYSAITIVLFIQLFLTYSTGPQLAVFIILLLLPFAKIFFKSDYSWQNFIPLSVFLILALFINKGNFYSDLYTAGKQFLMLIGILNSSGMGSDGIELDVNTFGTDRIGLWKSAISVALSNPIFGTGLGCMMHNGAYDRPHNEYLQYAANIGIIGALIYIAALVTMFVRACKNRKQTCDLSFLLGCSVYGYLISAFFGNTMPHVMPFFAVILGFYIYSIKPFEKNKFEKNKVA